MAGADLLNLGTSALLAFQQALSTTGNNISNANTPGYSRERVDLTTQPATNTTIGSLGNGVQVTDIKRLYDQLASDRVNDATSSKGQLDTYYGLASQLDNLLGSSSSGLSATMQSFFSSIQDVANDPSSVTNRQDMLSQAQSLVDTFHSYSGQLSTMQSDINAQLSDAVSQVNSLAQNIASINQQIVSTKGLNNNGSADLLDKRDQLLQKLSQYVSVKAVIQDNGAMNVFIGSGQPLVVGNRAQQLATASNQFNPQRLEVIYDTGSSSSVISSQLTGGTIGGLIQARQDIVDQAQNKLGQIATSLASDFNIQQNLGVDLNGNAGQDLFKVPSAQAEASSNNTGSGTVSATIANTANLTASNYLLTYDGSDTYTLTRQSDNKTFTINTGGSYPYTTKQIDGFTLTINAGAAVNDSYLIQPTINGASDLALATTQPADIAAGAPIQAQAGTGNAGSATISAGSVNSPNDKLAVTFNSPASTFNVVDQTTGATLATNQVYTSGGDISFNGVTFQISNGGSAPAAGDQFTVNAGQTSAAQTNTGGGQISAATVNAPAPGLTTPVTITFNNPPTSYNVSGATSGSPTTNVPYTSGSPISYDGWTVAISGTPSAGDSFTVAPGSSGVGDNRNALQMAAFNTAKVLDGGTASLQDAYGQLVTDIGTKTQQANLSSQAQQALLNQAQQEQQSVSGVNLDEEAANLVKYQQAYQAAAHLISVSDTLFQSLLGAFR